MNVIGLRLALSRLANIPLDRIDSFIDSMSDVYLSMLVERMLESDLLALGRSI